MMRKDKEVDKLGPIKLAGNLLGGLPKKEFLEENKQKCESRSNLKISTGLYYI